MHGASWSMDGLAGFAGPCKNDRLGFGYGRVEWRQRAGPRRRGRARHPAGTDGADSHLGLHHRRRQRRRRSAVTHHRVPPLDHHLRSGDAAHGRAGAAAGAGRRRRRLHGADPDRAGHGGIGGRGDQGRRLRLPDQADRAAAAQDPARQDRRAARHAARGEGAAQAAARPRRLRPDDRQRPADAEGLPDHRAGRADLGVGAHLGRVGHRQGAGGADHPSAQPARAPAVRADQLRGDSRDAARERDLRPREGRVHRRLRSARGLLRAGRSRHAVPRRDRGDDAGHAGQAAARAAGAQVPPARRPARAVGRRAGDRGHQRHPARGREERASCARTCSTASTCSPSSCRRCASARKTCRC